MALLLDGAAVGAVMLATIATDFRLPRLGLATKSAMSDSSIRRMPISSIIISKLSSLSGETTSSGSLVLSSSYVR
ncbi:hypothetical protein D3C83_226250 [compost metagenome]